MHFIATFIETVQTNAKKVDDKQKVYLKTKRIEARQMYGIPKFGSHPVSNDEEEKTSEKSASNVYVIKGEVDEQPDTCATGL